MHTEKQRLELFLVTATLVAVVSSASTSLEDLEFHAWKVKFGKSYGSVEEEIQRKSTWLTNRKMILEHNLLADKGIKTYRLGLNQFSDMENEEFKQVVLKGCLNSFNKTNSSERFLRQTGGAVLPTFVDWRMEGYVTDVKQQGTCESCWAFSVTGALEGQMFRKTRKLVPLSEQHLIDCSWLFGNKGCSGGLMNQTYEYIMSSGGLETEYFYPYEAKEGLCRFNPQYSFATCRGYVDLPSGDEYVLQEAVASVGPISAAVDANGTFRHYSSGVYNEPDCKGTPNHAILIVGYGTTCCSQTNYWLVKNSWGPEWGENGYVMMSRNSNNQCGIATMASYPLV